MRWRVKTVRTSWVEISDEINIAFVVEGVLEGSDARLTLVRGRVRSSGTDQHRQLFLVASRLNTMETQRKTNNRKERK